jgi:hypothetical protein
LRAPIPIVGGRCQGVVLAPDFAIASGRRRWPENREMLSPWYVVVRGVDVDLARLRDVCGRTPEHSFEEELSGEWRLRSSTVGPMFNHEDAWPALCDLLVRLSDVAAAAGNARVRLAPAALGRTRSDGASDVFVHPPTIRLRVQALPPTIIVNGAVPEPADVKLLRLQATNEHLRLALHFLNAELSWSNLWKFYESIRDANNGAPRLVVMGWTSQPELDRFRRTANTYSAVGDEARHAILGEKSPPTPMSLEEAEDYIRGMLARWLDSS